MTQEDNKFHYHVTMDTVDGDGKVLSTLGPYTVRYLDKAHNLAMCYGYYIAAFCDATFDEYQGSSHPNQVRFAEDNRTISDGQVVGEYQVRVTDNKTEIIKVKACSGEMMSKEEADELLAQKLSEELGFVVTPTLHPVTGQPGFTIDMPDALAEILAEVGIGEVISKPRKDIIFH